MCSTATGCTAGNSGRSSAPEHKVVTTVTNGFGDTEIVGGYDDYFALWPVHFWQNNGIGTDQRRKNSAPICRFTAIRVRPSATSTTVLWPFFSWIDDRGKKYREWQGPWPFVIFARGEGKTTTRVLPLFSRAHNDTLESDFYLWPLYKYNRTPHGRAGPAAHAHFVLPVRRRRRKKTPRPAREKQRVDMWPLFTWQRDFNGNRRLQILAPVEPALPDNRGVERNWSPLWSLWRAGEQSANRRRQPVAAVESLPQRHDAGLKKMLAPVRPFPVSIRRGDEETAAVLHSGGP